MKRKYTVLLDCGDTIVDEATEIKDARGATQRAELIPGADRMVRGLVEKGFRIALVADGYSDTFHNVLTQHGLIGLFETMAISEEVGVDKPDPKMFKTALDALGIGSDSYDKVVMVGNNLERDIRGANALGIVSVWLSWSPRRAQHPTDPRDVPKFEIKNPEELLSLMDKLEAETAVK